MKTLKEFILESTSCSECEKLYDLCSDNFGDFYSKKHIKDNFPNCEESDEKFLGIVVPENESDKGSWLEEEGYEVKLKTEKFVGDFDDEEIKVIYVYSK